MATSSNQSAEPLVGRPASLAEKDGQITMTKEDFEKYEQEYHQTVKDAKTYASESRDRRIALTKSEEKWQAEVDAREAKIKELEAKKETAEDPAEVARLNRRLVELEERDKKREAERLKEIETARAKTVKADLSAAISQAKLISPDEALALLTLRARTAGDGATELRVVDGDEEKWVAATAENVKKFKMLSDWFFPADSEGGSGARGGGPEGRGGSTGVLAKALDSQKEYEKNREAANAEYDASIRVGRR